VSYRPITDTWILARSKVKYYGAYPAGFLERARALMGVDYGSQILHVCSGKVHDYPYKRYALGTGDYTVDADVDVNPDYVRDVTKEIPGENWDAIIADPPYTEEDHRKYKVGQPDTWIDLPKPTELLKMMLQKVKPGGRVGILHYILPRPPKGTRFVACITVIVGFGNRPRLFSVFERER
jgi:hypothetical protein